MFKQMEIEATLKKVDCHINKTRKPEVIEDLKQLSSRINILRQRLDISLIPLPVKEILVKDYISIVRKLFTHNHGNLELCYDVKEIELLVKPAKEFLDTARKLHQLRECVALSGKRFKEKEIVIKEIKVHNK